MSTSASITLVVAGVSSAVALLTFVYGVLEYRRQGRQRRTEQFFAFGRRVESDEIFVKLRDLLDAEAAEEPGATAELEGQPAKDKYHFMGAYEELAVLVNSGLVRLEIAHYMHGYPAILCKRSQGFWTGKNAPVRTDPHWHVFGEFADRMETLEARMNVPEPTQRADRPGMRF